MANDSNSQLIAGDILVATGAILFFFICFVDIIMYRSEQGLSCYKSHTIAVLFLSVLALASLITGIVLIATYTPSFNNSTIIIIG